MYQRQGAAAYKMDLSNIKRLSAYLGNPHTQFKAVHIGGTNGKGSTSHMLASILQEAGYAVGLYTSPHLKDFRERIRINGIPISKQMVIHFIRKHKAFFEAENCSFFEMTVALAFSVFARKKVDIAIIEVGLGGRLDATNIILPELSVITNIGLDHTQFLGNTLEQIAGEKAGIIKRNTPVVIGEYQDETINVFENIATAKNASLHKAYTKAYPDLKSDLKGSYQMVNKQTVQCAVEVLMQLGWKIKGEHLKSGLSQVIRNTGILGRWQSLGEDPQLICDTAHNREGLLYVLKQLEEMTYAQLHIVLGVVSDKKLETILPLFPSSAIYYFCKPDIARGMEANKLRTLGLGYDLKGAVYESVQKALCQAKRMAEREDLIFIGGSTFVVAEIL